MRKDKIIVLDFGGQYTQLITKAIRKTNVFSEIKPYDIQPEELRCDVDLKGIILSGGPDSVYREGAPRVERSILELGIPILGICYGMQHINHTFAGDAGILKGDLITKEYGETQTHIDVHHPLFSGLEEKIITWMSHGDSVNKNHLGSGFRVIGTTKNHVAAIADDERNIYGVQFHPEVTHTEGGLEIIAHFVHRLCKCSSDWTMGNYIEESKEYIRNNVGTDDVVCFVSGGVDSTYVAAVVSQTQGIGQVHTLYVDALMRKHETEEVKRSLKAAGVKDLVVVDARERFLEAISGMQDPEKKRKAIGNLFGKIQQEFIEQRGLDPKKVFLAQGTLYTDLIESGFGVGKKADTIKSHHNVGCSFIKEMKENKKIIEPNRWIFKDEVREAAREIGLPKEIYARQPFPGPGGGIRIVDAKEEWIDDQYHTAAVDVKKIAAEYGLEGYVIPIKTVGVQGDSRTYQLTAVLRGERDWKNLRDAAKHIPDAVYAVNRVIYDTNTAQASVYPKKLIQTDVREETFRLWQDIDKEGMDILNDYKLNDKISQSIFVLFGSDMYNVNKRSVALRAVITDDFMTVSPARPLPLRKDEISRYDAKNPLKPAGLTWECLDEIRQDLLSKHDIGAFYIDITDKPPATTCWE